MGDDLPAPSADVAIVTGASRPAGIGAAVAGELARRGWSLLITGPQEEHDGLAEVGSACAEHGVRVESIPLDLADDAAPASLIDAAVDRLGGARALVSCAAVGERGDLHAVDAAQLDRHWRVNARAPILLARAFAARLTGRSGAIVSLTSGQSVGPMPDELAYAVSKGALDAFTVSAAPSLARQGIRINAVDPGPTDTGWMSEEDRRLLVAPLGRLGLPDDAARLVVYLCSDEGRWITGQVLRSRGGW